MCVWVYVDVHACRAWQLLLQALERLDGVKSESYVIDPKAISKVNSENH